MCMKNVCAPGGPRKCSRHMARWHALFRIIIVNMVHCINEERHNVIEVFWRHCTARKSRHLYIGGSSICRRFLFSGKSVKDTLGLQSARTQESRQSVYYLYELKDDRVKFHRDMVGLNIEEIMTDFRHYNTTVHDIYEA